MPPAGRAPRPRPGPVRRHGARASRASRPRSGRATSSSARRSAATARTAASRSWTVAVISAPPLPRATGREADEDEIERTVEIEPEPPAPSQVIDPVAGDLLEPARQGVVAGQIRDRGQRLDPRDRHDIRRVAVVREGDTRVIGRDRDECPAVGGGRERDRPRAEDDQTAGPLDAGEQTAQPIPERPLVRWAGDDLDVGRAGGEEPAPMPLGDLGACLGQPAGQRTGGRARFRVEDPNGDGWHRPESSGSRRPDRPCARDTGVVPERRVRAYIGLGSNIGDAEETLARAVHALAGPRAPVCVASRGCMRPNRSAFTDQPEFRNAVVALDVPAGPDPATGALALLSGLKALERSFGRVARARWGPRELDLDLLVFGRARLSVDRRRRALHRCRDRPCEGHQAARRPASGRDRAAVRPGAAGRPRPRPRAARLGRDGRDRPPPPGTRSRARRRSGRSGPGIAGAGRLARRQPR